MNEPKNSEASEGEVELSRKDWFSILKVGFIVLLATLIAFVAGGSLSNSPDNFLAKKYKGLFYKNPIKDPVAVQASIVNNPFVRYTGSTKAGYTSKCSYEVSYSFSGKSYTALVEDSVNTDRGDTKYYGCKPTNNRLVISISKADPSKAWLEPSITRDDKFIGLLFFVIFIGLLNWLRIKILAKLKIGKS